MRQASALPVSTIQAIVKSSAFVEATLPVARRICFLEAATATQDQIRRVNELTVGQRLNPLWRQVRRGRLTASDFGRALEAGAPSRSVADRLVAEVQFEADALAAADADDDDDDDKDDANRAASEAIEWGTENETRAVQWFENASGFNVKPSGIWLHSSGILGASPDGLIDFDDDERYPAFDAAGNELSAVLEVKCPFSARDYDSVREAAMAIPGFCLEVVSKKWRWNPPDHPPLRLKRTHRYWQQVQAQMHFADRRMCYFVVWLPRAAVALPVERDESWRKDDLPRLLEFYSTNVIGRLASDSRANSDRCE